MINLNKIVSEAFAGEDVNFLVYNERDIMSTSNTYPHDPDHDYEAYIEYINFDQERIDNVANGRGFIVEPSGRNIKKDLKAEDGIFSPRFGQTLADTNPYIERHKCRCTGNDGLRGRIHLGLRCPKCGHLCEFVDDDFGYFGWLVLVEPYKIIHPSFYKKIEAFLGKGINVQGDKRSKLENILDTSSNQSPLTSKANESKMKEEPFFGIGMMEFIERFDEIMDFYLKRKPNRKMYYDDIKNNRDIVFTSSIPVFTTLLRPIDINDGNMSYEQTNGTYSMMNKLVSSINKTKTKIQREPKIKNKQLYNLQVNFIKLYNEQEQILSGKKGDFRCLLGGRYTFSSRNVIVQNPDLRIDEVTLPAVALTILLEQRIKNILCRMYNMSPTEANDIWYKATIEPNKKVNEIIRSIINYYKVNGMRGVPVLINRNPTIGYGSILQMFCIDFTETYTMAVPLQPLGLLAADFDGDVLNILLPVNQTFIRLAWEKFNPRNVMYISRNDGNFNGTVSMQRDTLINANTLARLGRETYTQEDIQNMDRLFKIKQEMLSAVG